MVHHPRERAGVCRPKEGDRLSRCDERRDGQGRRALARAGRGRAVRRAAQAEHPPHRPGVLSRPLRQDRRRGLQGRQVTPSRQEHDLRRRALQAPEHRVGGDGARPPTAAGKEDQGHRAEPWRADGGFRVRRAASRQAGSVLGRAGEQHRGHDPRRGECRRRNGMHDGGRHRHRLVSHHAFFFTTRNADFVHEEVPRGKGDRKGDLCDRPGGGRDRGDWHGRRRGLGRRTGDDIDVGSRHLADERVCRPGVLRGDPGGCVRHPARRAVYRTPDPHGAGRHPHGRHAVPRRHETDSPDSLVGRRVLHDGHAGVRPRGTFPDAGVRDERSRPRDEHVDVACVHIPGGAARSRQGARRGVAPAAGRVGPLPRRRRRRNSLPDHTRHGHAGLFHARIRAQRKGPVQRTAGRLRPQHGASRAKVRNCARPRAQAGCGRRAGRGHRHRRLREQPLGDRREPRSACARDRPVVRVPPPARVPVHR